MKYSRLWLFMLVFTLMMIPGRVMAEAAYSFQISRLVVNVFWNDDGSSSIDYVFSFANDPSGHTINYIDVGVPNRYFEVNSIRADVDGKPVSDISTSGFQGTGSGVAIGLGSNSIDPGKIGNVHVFIGTVNRMMFPSTVDSTYASVNFIPHYYDYPTVHGNTYLSVIFHLPAGVQPDEGRWYAAPKGWQSQPDAALDDQGRVMYTWENPNANDYTSYLFGAGFPLKYVPSGAIVQKPIEEKNSNSLDSSWINLFEGICFLGTIGLIVFIGVLLGEKRKQKYFPPSIAIESYGIKRGLTAIEVATLMEEPVNKILTMILFAVIKKNAAQVVTREPLEIQSIQPTPQGLEAYEIEFLSAYTKRFRMDRQKALQDMVVNLIKSVSGKMKGFSRKETKTYYRDIIKKAWEQVETAGTPEVKSAKFDEVMEWTMLDNDYDERTRKTFSSDPVFLPAWWLHYDPSFSHSSGGSSGSCGSKSSTGGGGSISLPRLPGSDFAASITVGVQNFSARSLGSIADFTRGITNVTNPPPLPSGGGYGGSGGGGCACACACAGCACACAGGGR